MAWEFVDTSLVAKRCMEICDEPGDRPGRLGGVPFRRVGRFETHGDGSPPRRFLVDGQEIYDFWCMYGSGNNAPWRPKRLCRTQLFDAFPESNVLGQSH